MSSGIFEENDYRLIWSLHEAALSPAEASFQARRLLEEMEPGSSALLQKTATGKPFLADDPRCISFSHAARAVAVVMANVPVGMDIEAPEARLLRVKDRVFRPEECLWAGNDLVRLTTLWTAREAMYKLDGGRGLDFRKELWAECSEASDFPSVAWFCRKEREAESVSLRYLQLPDHLVCLAFRSEK